MTTKTTKTTTTSARPVCPDCGKIRRKDNRFTVGCRCATTSAPATKTDTTIADDSRRCPSCAAEALEFHTSIGKPRNASAAIVTDAGPRKGQVFYVSAGCEACGASFEVRARELLLDETHPLAYIALDTDDDGGRKAATERARIESQNGYVQHVNRTALGSFIVSDWYDADVTVASFENGKQL
jgi:hypothetical protein